MRIMLSIMMILLASGCSVTQMIDPYSEDIRLVCEEADSGDSVTVSFNGQTKSVGVHKTDNPDQIYDWCDNVAPSAVACTKSGDIYIPSGPTCYELAAHELGHVFMVPGLDIPRVGG